MLCPPMPPIWISEKSGVGSVTQWISSPPQVYDLYLLSTYFLFISCGAHLSFLPPPPQKRRTLAHLRSELPVLYMSNFTYLYLLYHLHVCLCCCPGYFGLLGPSYCTLSFFPLINKHSFLYPFQYKFFRNITVYESILLGPRLLYSF